VAYKHKSIKIFRQINIELALSLSWYPLCYNYSIQFDG